MEPPGPAAIEIMMETLNVELGDRSYPIYIGTGLLANPDLYRPHVRGHQAMIVTNETVAPLYQTTWFSVETVVGSDQVRDLIPELLKQGAEGIIEYPLNKVV